MRLFAIFCFLIAAYFGYTAVDSMVRGVTYPVRGETSVAHVRGAPGSNYDRYLLARWLLAGGFVAMGVVMHVFAARFEKLERDGSS
jgi:hypothetical protein